MMCSVVIGLISGFFIFTDVEKIADVPSAGLVVVYKKRPFFNPRVELRRLDGTLLDSKAIEGKTKATDIEIHSDPVGIVVLSGSADWVWKNDVWLTK